LRLEDIGKGNAINNVMHDLVYVTKCLSHAGISRTSIRNKTGIKIIAPNILVLTGGNKCFQCLYCMLEHTSFHSYVVFSVLVCKIYLVNFSLSIVSWILAGISGQKTEPVIN